MFEDLSNLLLKKAIRKKVGENVILYGLDGMSYFGKLSNVCDNDIAEIVPSDLASTGLVEIQNPAEAAAVENKSIIDLNYVVAFGYDITGDPFAATGDTGENFSTNETAAEQTPAAAPCQNNNNRCNNLIQELKSRNVGDLVTISALGGYLFTGRPKRIEDKVAKLKVEYKFAPGGDGSTLFAINKIIVNLKAATAISS